MTKTLKKIQKRIPKYFSYFKDDHILAISEDKMQLPFCFLIDDDRYPNKVLLSLAVDYPNSINVANLIVLAKIPMMLVQPFYISTTNGTTYIDDDAFHRWELEAINIEQLTPPTMSVN